MRTRLAVPVLPILALVFAVLPAVAAGAPEGRLVVSLRPEVTLAAGAPVTLADVARLEGPLAERAGRVRLGQAPPAGRSRVIGVLAIREALRRAGISPERVDVRDAGRVRIFGRGEPLGEAEVRAAIERMLGELHPKGKVTIEKVEIPRGLVLPPGKREVVARPPLGGLRAGRVRIPIEVKAGRRPPRRYAVSADLSIEAPVLVAARNLDRGARLRPGDLRLETRKLPPGKAVLDDPQQARGLVLRRPVRAGEPVLARQVTRPAAVEAGQPVRALFRRGAVTLELDTVARTRGDVGALVRVVGIDGRKTVIGRVVAPGRVVVLGSDEAAELEMARRARPAPREAREEREAR